MYTLNTFFLSSSRKNVAKNKEGLVGVPCGAGRNQIESLVFDVQQEPSLSVSP